MAGRSCHHPASASKTGHHTLQTTVKIIKPPSARQSAPTSSRKNIGGPGNLCRAPPQSIRS
ncbi:hypothetical protein HMPREF9593_01888 [Cutibacterium acnes HL046PA2]|nr:hypothetical protein HMPREF9593_01888 [Cutibacterium acnes HL046PA2]